MVADVFWDLGMRFRVIKRALVLLLLAGLGCREVAATLIDFTGLQGSARIPTGYSELNWSGFNALNSIDHANDAAGNMYAYFNVGPSYTTFPFTASIFADEGEVFDLLSAKLSANWKAGLAVQVQGYLDGVLTSEQSLTLAYRSFNPVYLSFMGVDEVRFVVPAASYQQYTAGSGGSGKPYYWQQQYAFSLDDLSVTAPRQVPDAGATLLLLGLGLLGLGGIRWHARGARCGS